MKAIATIFAILIGFLPLSANADRAELLLRTFEELAYTPEFEDRNGTKLNHIIKWQRSIRYKVMQGGTGPQKAALKTQMGRLSALTGVPVGEAGFFTGQENYRVYFVASVREVSMVAKLYGFDHIGPAICFAIVFRDKGDASINSAVVILITDTTYFLPCLVEETTQAFGLINDSDMIRPSVFSDRDQHLTDLTKSDLLMVRALYDPSLTSGMTKETARPVLRRIFRELTDVE